MEATNLYHCVLVFLIFSIDSNFFYPIELGSLVAHNKLLMKVG